MSKWIKDRNPNKDGKYLCIVSVSGGFYSQKIMTWTNNLYKKDPYAFEMYKNKKDRSGWYEYNSEWDCYNIKRVFAWRELPEMPEEFSALNSKVNIKVGEEE